MSDQFSLNDQPEYVELCGLWERALAALKEELPRTAIERFLGRMRPISLEAGEARFDAPTRFVREWIEDKYLDRIEGILSGLHGRPVRLLISADDDVKPSESRPEPDRIRVKTAAEPAFFRPDARFTFDQFVIGNSNRYAEAAAKNVATNPGQVYNPLFIFGPPGVGKTHLLHAMAHECMKRASRTQVLYVTGQRFAEDFISHLRSNRIEQFRRRHRTVDFWLVDDVQFIIGKERTTEEFFHTFNYLRETGVQIVFSSDEAPGRLELDERLRSRMESGLVADIQLPDTELRAAIALRKADADGIELPVDVAQFLAENVDRSIRSLEGAIKSLAAQSSLDGSSIDLALAGRVVEQLYSREGGLPGPQDIIKQTAKELSIPEADIVSASRKAPIAHARHIAIYLTREITAASWKHIGTQFGGRDHTSAIHSHKRVAQMVASQPEVAEQVRRIRRALGRWG